MLHRLVIHKFIRESGLMFRTFAEFIFKMIFSRRAEGCTKCFWKFCRGGGFIFLLKKWKFCRGGGGGGGSYLKFPPWQGYGSFLEPHI